MPVLNEMFDSGLKKEDLDPHLVFSPSQLDTWDSCMTKGMYVYRHGYRAEVTDKPARLGTVIHEMLDLYYQGWTTVQMMDKYEEDDITYDTRVLAYAASGLMFRYENYYREQERRVKVLATEQYLLVPYTTPAGRHVYLNGFVDLIVENNGLGVFDHKSGGRFWTADMVYFDRQLMIYAYMLHVLGYSPRFGVINNINTTHIQRCANRPVEDLFSRVPAKFTERRIVGYIDQVGRAIDTILAAETYPRHLSRSCASCQFKEACALELEGVDATAYLKTNFNSRGDSKQLDVTVEGLPDF